MANKAKKKRAVDQRGDEGEIGERGVRGHVARPHADETEEERAARLEQHQKDNPGAEGE